MAENMMNSEHKGTNKNYRTGYDGILKACGHPMGEKCGCVKCKKCGEYNCNCESEYLLTAKATFDRRVLRLKEVILNEADQKKRR